MSSQTRPVQRAIGLLARSVTAAALIVVCGTTSAAADSDASIDHVETTSAGLRLLYSLPDTAARKDAELGSLRVTINDEPVKATASPAGEAVRRTTILAIDVSNSMRGQRFIRAKQAAEAFIDAAPADVLVGIVSFAGDVQTVQVPTLDRSRLQDVIDDLKLSRSTRLYDGVLEAIDTLANQGQRRLVVLSDGKDTSDTSIEDVTETITDTNTKVDIVALEQSSNARRPLELMAAAGKGVLLTAEDPRALIQAFSEEAAYLENQVLVEVTVPKDLSGSEGTVAVSVDAANETYTGSAFVTLQKQAVKAAPVNAAPQAMASPPFAISNQMMLLGLGGTGVGVLLVLLVALGVFKSTKKETLEDRVAAYSRTGHAHAVSPTGSARPKTAVPQKSVAESAVGAAQKALTANKGLESLLAAKLDPAGMSLKPAEWLLLHAGIAVVAAAVGFLFTSGGVLATLFLFVGGAVLPWMFLSFKKSRRLKAFNSHLGETLQLVSGGLSAGLSLAQSLDTVVREGTEPIAGEFRRALVEARLGVQIEDALDSVGQRMESEDFGWVVMAIRIQRDVGGNLAELLLSVAATMREREYLRRQVKSLSAEGRLSGLILGALPPVVLIFLNISNPDYLNPLFANTLGWLLIAAMVMLMSVGSFWMSRLVKVEV